MQQHVNETMKKARKGFWQVVFGRTTILVALVLLQIALLFVLFSWLSNYVAYFYALAVALSACIVIYIVNRETNPAFKISWLLLVLGLPVVGVLFYLFLQNQLGVRVMEKRLAESVKETRPYLGQDLSTTKAIEKDAPQIKGLSHYVQNYAGFPTYQNSQVTYYPTGEENYVEILRQLKTARDFIFLEYFIIEQGQMWDGVLEVLKEKVREGVEVRLLYDGTNSLSKLPVSYPKQIRAYGIQCHVFLPVKPLLSTSQNNRDHRKIIVIDGHTAFTGGINMADEYINTKERFGYWKDNGVMVQGEAVRSFTMMFLQNWNIAQESPERYEKYLVPALHRGKSSRGFVIPYGDSPLDKENVGEMIYLDILANAKNYVHIFTPYLILDQEMSVALKFAAKRGVDVKIILPHIPDKKYAYFLARTHYKELIRAGVKIYEFIPGFVHAKVFVSDNICCTVGTVNLDFRSLYLHYECGIYAYDNPVVAQVEQDIEQTLERCKRITMEDCNAYPMINRLAGRVLRIVAPLM